MICQNKYKIGFIVSSTIALIAIVFVVSTYSLATENHTIYTRDQLSEIIKNQQYEYSDTINIVNDSNQSFKIYVDGSLTTNIDSSHNYRLDSFSCNGNESIIWKDDEQKLDVYSLGKETNCLVYLQIVTKFKYNSDVAYYPFTVTQAGYYRIELWGGGAGGFRAPLYYSGSGYTSGIIYLNIGDTLYFYVGSKGHNGSKSINFTQLRSYNGGGAGANTSATLPHSSSPYVSSSGGGATDVRLTAGDWNNTASLRSRIMVAGSAGGDALTSSNPPYGGGLYGGSSSDSTGSIGAGRASQGATQFTGGIPTSGTAYGSGITVAGTNGSFGQGGSASIAVHPGGGGGGGYYGGASGSGGENGVGGSFGSGGSSYISGHAGCVALTSSGAVRKDSTASILCDSSSSTGYRTKYNVDIECSKHYSGKVFTDTLMIDGIGNKWKVKGESLTVSEQKMPNPTGGYYDRGLGHNGDGVAQIYYIGTTLTS